MYRYKDEYGEHEHNTLSGPPYEPKKPITCTACLDRLNAARVVWQKKMTTKYKLPDGFWDSVPASWE